MCVGVRVCVCVGENDTCCYDFVCVCVFVASTVVSTEK
jgi:hypothetical protein